MKSIIVFLAIICVALASHGRFGTIKFVKNPSNPLSVTFTFNAVFRRTYFAGPPNIGSTITDAQFAFGDGAATTIPLLVTDINTVDDWVIVTWTGTHNYGGAGTYTVGWSSCCRILTLNNDESFSYAFTALLKITAAEISSHVVNQSPVSGMLPIVQVPYNIVPFFWNIIASDPENGALAYTMASAAQQGDPSSTQPPGLSVNSVSGQVTLSTALAQGYWTTQQIVTDNFGNWISIDYMLNVQPVQTYCNGLCIGSPNPQCVSDADCVTCNTTCVQALPRLITNDINSGLSPRTNLPTPLNGQTFNRNVGQQVVVNYVADDANLRNPANGVTIYASNTPAGSVFPPQVECNAASGCQCIGCNALPQLRTLTWTPTASDVGSNTVCIGVQSLANYLPYAQHCITINVIALPITSGALTTQALTTGVDLTTQFLTTQELTTQELTTQELTTQELTTQPLTTQPLTTQPLTTSFATVGARCATLNFPETQGYFCATDGSYYQCLKGPFATISANRPCPPGTSCKCPYGVECSVYGLCTYGSFQPPYTWTTGQ